MEAIGMVLLVVLGVLWGVALGIWLTACCLAARKWPRPARVICGVGVVAWLVPAVLVSYLTLHSWFIDEPFSGAMYGHDFGRAKALLRLGANPNADFEGACPLAEAAEAGDTEMVRLLLRHGTEPDALTNLVFQKYTALGIAKKNSHEDVVKLLKKAGAKRCIYVES